MARGKKKNKNWRPKNGPSHEWEFTAAELAAPRPPSWAKGKDIGMWHKAKNRRKFLKGDNDVDDKIGQRKGAKAEKRAPNRCVELTFPVDKVKEIQNMLKTIGVPAPPCVQSTRVKKVQDQYKHVEDSPFKKTFLRCISGNIQDRISSTSLCSLRKDPVLDDQYFNEEKAKPANHKVREMSNFRQRLPAWDKKNQLLTALDQNNVILVTGETGCGKTTQVPQFILEDAVLNGNASQTYIMVTQPRRISAITVAERVANERGERLGQSVGYQIRLEKVMPRSVASILFCTTGVLLQYMHSDPLLTRVSTVVVDEIHERNTISDFVITLLRDIAPRRPDLKIILMSATLNADLFSKYFNDCPTVHIPGFTFNVEEFYLEDVLETVGFRFPFKPKNKKGQKNDLDQDSLFLEAFYRDIESSGKYSKKTVESLKSPESNEINLPLVQQLIEHICTKMGPGAILVFLTGWDKISALNRLLNESGKFPYYRYRIIPLHSLMPTSNQRQVFERPPKGVRKIVLATNIAETSITIDDVVYVIDCGKIKIKNFDVDGNISTLKEEWVSLANARQRRGRAGRVQNGICFHLYSKGREMLLAKDMLPEMLRTRLEEVILQAKILQVGKIERFLQKVIDPPTAKAVELSLKLLADMNAIDDNENLTPLGYHLASLPIDPQAGKMLLFGSLFGILDPISSVAAALSFKDPFVIPLGQEKAVDKVRHSFDADHKSDHLIIAKTIAQYENAVANRTAPKFINDNYLSQSVIEQLRDMKRQLVSLLSDMKFAANPRVDSRENNENSMNIALVRAVVCAGLFPNIAIVEKAKILKNGRAITRVITMDGNQIVEFHPKSIFSSNNVYHSKFVAYFEKLRSSRINLFDSTMVYPMTLIFTCHDLKVHTKSDHKIIDIGHNVHFKASNDLAGVVLELRAWLDWLIEYRMCHPGAMKWGENSDESVVLKAVAELITTDEQIRNRDADDDADADADADLVSDDEDGSCEDDSDVEDVE